MTNALQKINLDDDIGIIGLGRMGHGIAYNLLKAGFKLHGLNHPGNQPVDMLIAQGAVMHDHIKDMAGQTKLIIICVTGTDDVEEVLCGPSGILASAPLPLMIMDCSTGIPLHTQQRHDKAAQDGHFFFDAAMTRTPAEAAEGRLNLIIGGDEELRENISAVLDPIAEIVTMAGQIGMGQHAKLIHNFVSLGFSAILAEATARADINGLDRSIFLELIGQGGGGGIVFERFRPYLEQGRKDAFNFTISNAVKDLSYFKSISGEDSINNAVLSLYEQADHGDDTTIPELVDHIRDNLKTR